MKTLLCILLLSSASFSFVQENESVIEAQSQTIKRLSVADQDNLYNEIFSNSEKSKDSIKEILDYAFSITKDVLLDDLDLLTDLDCFYKEMNQADLTIYDLYAHSLRLSFLLESKNLKNGSGLSDFSKTLFPFLDYFFEMNENQQPNWKDYGLLKTMFTKKLVLDESEANKKKSLKEQAEEVLGEYETDHLNKTAIYFFDKTIKNPALKPERILTSFFEGVGVASFSVNGAKGPHDNEVSNGLMLVFHDFLHKSIINKTLADYDTTFRDGIRQSPKKEELGITTNQESDFEKYDATINLKSKLIGDFRQIYGRIQKIEDQDEKKDLTLFLFKLIHEYIPSGYDIAFTTFQATKQSIDTLTLSEEENFILNNLDIFSRASSLKKDSQDSQVLRRNFVTPLFENVSSIDYNSMAFNYRKSDQTFDFYVPNNKAQDSINYLTSETSAKITIKMPQYDPNAPHLEKEIIEEIYKALGVVVEKELSEKIFHPEKIWRFNNADTPTKGMDDYEVSSDNSYIYYVLASVKKIKSCSQMIDLIKK